MNHGAKLSIAELRCFASKVLHNRIDDNRNQRLRFIHSKFRISGKLCIGKCHRKSLVRGLRQSPYSIGEEVMTQSIVKARLRMRKRKSDEEFREIV